MRAGLCCEYYGITTEKLNQNEPDFEGASIFLECPFFTDPFKINLETHPLQCSDMHYA